MLIDYPRMFGRKTITGARVYTRGPASMNICWILENTSGPEEEDTPGPAGGDGSPMSKKDQRRANRLSRSSIE